MTTNFKSIGRAIRRGKAHVTLNTTTKTFEIYRNAPLKSRVFYSYLMSNSSLTKYCK